MNRVLKGVTTHGVCGNSGLKELPHTGCVVTQKPPAQKITGDIGINLASRLSK